MKSPLRLLSRLVFLLVVLVLLAIGGVLAVFTSWRSDRIAELDGGSEVVQTMVGPVEFHDSGDGPAVLIFHGTPGGYDQAKLLGSGLKAQGFQILAPSRPGYLRTPLSSGMLPEQQADAMAALMDTMGFSNVAVLGVSGGAPAAVQFAFRYPSRTRALVLVSAISKTEHYSPTQKKTVLGERLSERLTGDIGSWLCLKAAERDPRPLLEEAILLSSTADEVQRTAWVDSVLANEDQLEWFRGLLGTCAPLSPREAGLRNDLLQFRRPPNVRYENLTVPTMVIHGTLDRDIPFADAKAMAARIPQGTLLPVEGEGDLVLLGPQAEHVWKKMADFLNLYPPKAQP